MLHVRIAELKKLTVRLTDRPAKLSHVNHTDNVGDGNPFKGQYIKKRTTITSSRAEDITARFTNAAAGISPPPPILKLV